MLFIHCKETSPGWGAGVLGLILWLLQVCGVTLGKLPHLFNERMGRLAAKDPLGADVQFSGRGSRHAHELHCGALP